MESKDVKVIIQTSGSVNRTENLSLTKKDQKKLETYTSKLVNPVVRIKKPKTSKTICSNCGRCEFKKVPI